MPTTVENRVVEMEFDNKRFEANVKETMTSIEKLKEALTFKGLKSGFDEIEQNAKKLNLSPLEKSVDTVKDKFSAMEIVAISALMRITNQAMATGERLVKSLTIDQATAGFDKYAEKTQAVQVIMNATGKSIEEVDEQLEKLAWFTDETSYSFLDMVNNIGKFTSNSVDLETAVTAMQGISTWAAKSGANVQEASRAMYNLSQAISVGSVKLMDWKSIENANMATAEFKQTVVDTALELGTLKKASDGTITTLKGNLVSARNFNSALSDSWFTSEVLLKSLDRYGNFTDKLFDATEKTGLTASQMLAAIEEYKAGTLDLSKFSDDLKTSVENTAKYIAELSDDAYDFGRKAFKAAQEAKTFKEAIDATKDAVSSGWMKTYEIIFGNYKEATKLWTAVANILWEIFAGNASERNETLKAWKEAGGRDGLINAMSNAFMALWNVIKPVREAFREIFPKKDYKQLKAMTDKLVEFTSHLQISDQTAQNVKDAFKGLFTVFKQIGTGFADIVKKGQPLWKLLGTLVRFFIALAGAAGRWAQKQEVINKIFSVFIKIIKVGLTVVIGLLYAVITLVAKMAELGSWLKDIGVFKVITTPVQVLAGAIIFLYQSIRNLLGLGLKAIPEFIQSIDAKLSALAYRISRFPVVQQTIAFLSTALEAVKNVLAGIGEKVAPVWNFFKDVAGLLSQGKWQEAFTLVADKLKDITESLKTMITDGLFGGFKDENGNVMSAKDKLDQFTESLKKFRENISIGKIVAVGFAVTMLALSASVTRLADSTRGVMDSLKNLITSGNKIMRALATRTAPVRQFAEAIAIVAGSLALLSLMDQEKLKSSAKYIAGIMGTLAVFSVVITALSRGSMKHEFRDFSKNINTIAISVISLAAGVLALTLAMRALEGVTIDKTIVGKMVIIGVLMAGLVTAGVALAKFAPKLSAGGLILVLYALSVKKIVDALVEFNNIDVTGLEDKVLSLISLMAGLAVLAMGMGQIRLSSVLGVLLLAATFKMVVPVFREEILPAINELSNGFIEFCGKLADTLTLLLGAENTLELMQTVMNNMRKVVITAMVSFTALMVSLSVFGKSLKNIGKGVGYFGAGLSVLLLAIGGLLVIMKRNQIPFQAFGKVADFIHTILKELTWMIGIAAIFSGSKLGKWTLGGESSIFGQFAKMLKSLSFLFISILGFTAIATIVASGKNAAAFESATHVIYWVLGLMSALVAASALAGAFSGGKVLREVMAIAMALDALMVLIVIMSAVDDAALNKALGAFTSISMVLGLLIITAGIMAKSTTTIKSFKANIPMLIMVIGGILALAGSIALLAAIGDIPAIATAVGSLLAVFLVVTSVISKIHKDLGDKKSTKFIGVIQGITLAMAALIPAAFAIAVIATLSPSWQQTMVSVVALAAVFAAVSLLLEKVAKTGKSAAGITTAAGAIVLASASLILIAMSIVALTNLTNSMADATEAAWALGSMVVAITGALTLLEKFSKSSASLIAAAFAVDIMTASLLIIAQSLVAVKDYNTDDFVKKLTAMSIVLGVVAGLIGIIGGVLGGSGAGWIAIAGMLALALAVDMVAWAFLEAAKALDTAITGLNKLPEFLERMSAFPSEDIARVAGSLVVLSDSLDGYGKVGKTLKKNADGLMLGGTGIITIAEGLAKLGDISLTPEQLEAFSEGLKKLSTAGELLISRSIGLINAGNGLTLISAGLSSLGSTSVTPEAADKWGDALAKIGEAGIVLLYGSLGMAASGEAMKILATGLSALVNVSSSLSSAAPNAIDGFVNEINSPRTKAALGKSGESYANMFLQPCYDTWGQHSPWKTMITAVGYASAGIGIGVGKSEKTVGDFGKIFASPFFKAAVGTMTSTATIGMKATTEAIKDESESPENVKTVKESGANTANEWWSSFVSTASGWWDSFKSMFSGFTFSTSVKGSMDKAGKSINNVTSGLDRLNKAYKEGGLTGAFGEGKKMLEEGIEWLSEGKYMENVGKGLDDLKDEFGLVFGDSNDMVSQMTDAINSATSAYDDLGSSATKTKTFVEQLTDTIEQQMDVFTEFNSKTEVTGEQMLNNMASQVSGVRQWAENLKYLAERGIDDGLLQKLTELGPAGYEKVAAFVNMTDEQLQMAGSLFQESLSLPESTSKEVSRDWWKTGEEAAGGFTQGITSPESTQAAEEAGKTIANVVRVELSKIIPDTIKTGKRTPEQLAKGIDANKDEAVKTAKFLGTSVVNAVDVIMNGGQNHQSGSPYIGKMFVKGLVDGMNSESKNLVTAASLKANTLMYAMRKTLDEHSPSKEAFKIGDFFIRGLVLGLQSDNNLVKRTSEESATNIMDAFGQTLMATEAYSFSPTVRPVLDLDSFNQDYSKFSSIMDAGYSKNLSGSMHTYASFDDSLLNALENLGDNSDVVDEVRSLSGRIADMTQQIGKMQVVLDSGTMVGALVTPLDQALGNKAIRSRRERR